MILHEAWRDPVDQEVRDFRRRHDAMMAQFKRNERASYCLTWACYTLAVVTIARWIFD